MLVSMSRRRSLLNLFVFVQVWLGAISPPDPKFVIHGLWPEYSNGSWPSYCDPDAVFNQTQLAPILPQMLEYWPGLYPNPSLQSSISFWKHEYMKHATCANIDDDYYYYRGEDVIGTGEFFSSVLNLRERYSAYDMLKGIGIVPDSSIIYNKTLVAEKFSNEYDGIIPILTCGKSTTTLPQLETLALCIGPDMVSVNCSDAILTSFGDTCSPAFIYK